MKRALWPVLLFCLLLAACRQEPIPANPALWEVRGENDERGWLFGTIHSLERPVDWKTRKVADALGQADLLMVEVANLDDPSRITDTFAKLARSPGHPPLSHRVAADKIAPLTAMLDRHGFKDNAFGNVETWAVALTLAQAETRDLDSKYGIDRAVIEDMAGTDIYELEGVEKQLSIFDALPESDQRDLLEAVITDSRAPGSESRKLVDAWRTGDMETIERETEKGMLADPELRDALLTGRNAQWAKAVASAFKSGQSPFVAVGAAHMAGPEGLPALLATQGYTVTRIQ